MPDDRTLGEAFRLIERQDRLCADRAAQHVDERRWKERNDEIAALFRAHGNRSDGLEREIRDGVRDIRGEIKDLTARQDRFRWGLVTAALGPLLTALFALIFWMSGVGGPPS